MTLYLAIILVSGLVTAAMVPLVKRLAVAVGAVDSPGERRKVHERQVPRLGGVAIFLPVMLSLGVGLWIPPGDNLHLGNSRLIGLVVGSGLIFLLGVYDDIRGVKAPVKLMVQVAAAGLLYFSGVRILEVWTSFEWMIPLGIFALPLTLFWLVGLTNGMNLLDGIDGLAAGVSAMVSLIVLFISFGQGNTQLSLTAATLLGSLLGFLVFNFYPAKIFLGDCGAMFLGFFLAAISVMGNQKSASAVAMAVPIVALGIPIFDTSLTIIRRALRGQHPFRADRYHVHHRLLALGLSQPQVAITLYVVSSILATMALLMSRANQAASILIVLCLALGASAAVRRLKAGEFSELGRLFQYGERRRRPPRYRAILVRNTLPLLERCKRVSALEFLLEEVRKDLGFETLQVRFMADVTPAILGGALEVAVIDQNPPQDADLLNQGGAPWTGTAEIFCNLRTAECGGIQARGARGEARGGAESRERGAEEQGSRGAGGWRSQDLGGGRNGGPEKGGQEDNGTGRHLLSRTECRMRNEECGGGRARVVGEVIATKPAWKTRRASENDEELLQLLADGLGMWLATHMDSPLTARPKILVAEDDERMRRLLRDILEDSDDVVQAGDGAEATRGRGPDARTSSSWTSRCRRWTGTRSARP